MKKSLLLLAAALLTITSCKKDAEQTNEIKNPCLVTESTVVNKINETDKFIYTYDDKGRLLSVKENDSFLDQYTYSADQITLKRRNLFTVFFKLDAQNRVVRITYSDISDIVDLTYNAQGYLIEDVVTKKSGSTSTTKYFYTNGNLSSFEDWYGTHTILYGNDLADDNFIDEGDNELPTHCKGTLRSYFGKASKNLPIKITSKYDYHEDFIYDKDVKGNITKVQVTASNNAGYVSSMKYNCR